ncbi:hypothetical protein VNO78_10949 [Psophocarpus tetragonolobus]|uniref:Uncharacterized protein n=1 Tax=Psophocarpus tetragonolobus TaxID=3891 RepID=A0AAN9XN77_PSOTE
MADEEEQQTIHSVDKRRRERTIDLFFLGERKRRRTTSRLVLSQQNKGYDISKNKRRSRVRCIITVVFFSIEVFVGSTQPNH